MVARVAFPLKDVDPITVQRRRKHPL